MALIDTDKLSTVGDYAKLIGVTGQTLQKWLEEEAVKPTLVAGNTRLFDVDELAKVCENKNTSLSKLKALGYVHPDQHKVTLERAENLATENAQLMMIVRHVMDHPALDEMDGDAWREYMGESWYEYLYTD